MKKLLIFLIVILMAEGKTYSQEYFRSGIFLHHSTGQYIWGPNPDGTSTTTIPDQMSLFNDNHGLSGNEAVSLLEEWWAPDDNEWSTQHEFFEGNTAFTDINYYLNNYKILVVKSCFPSSAIEVWGQPSDSADPTFKSVYNYKWHWRHILAVMKSHPANFFAIWTNAPLEQYSTSPEQAALAKLFTRWAKDTLAAGLDPEFGEFPPNVYVFDYFNKITGPDGIEPDQYATAMYDSHPNGAATDLIAPQFVDEIFSAAMEYEQIYYGIPLYVLKDNLTCYPNPFHQNFSLKIALSQPATVSVSIYNNFGQLIFNYISDAAAGEYNRLIDFSGIQNGVYYYQVIAGESVFNGKLVNQ
ncbi:MAG: T9SS type A sorting domain-containing protein [Bacteroidetes bacterium]|nr:T9SS type A sorting domain-containing protein [Bacteroidota bacterium]